MSTPPSSQLSLSWAKAAWHAVVLKEPSGEKGEGGLVLYTDIKDKSPGEMGREGRLGALHYLL